MNKRATVIKYYFLIGKMETPKQNQERNLGKNKKNLKKKREGREKTLRTSKDFNILRDKRRYNIRKCEQDAMER